MLGFASVKVKSKKFDLKRLLKQQYYKFYDDRALSNHDSRVSAAVGEMVCSGGYAEELRYPINGDIA
jgi:hypothetical protein